MIKQRQQLIEMHLCFCKTSKFYWMLSISFILIEEIFLICSVFLQSESCNSVVIYEKYQTGYRKRYLFVFVILRSIVSIQHCNQLCGLVVLIFRKCQPCTVSSTFLNYCQVSGPFPNKIVLKSVYVSEGNKLPNNSSKIEISTITKMRCMQKQIQCIPQKIRIN